MSESIPPTSNTLVPYDMGHWGEWYQRKAVDAEIERLMRDLEGYRKMALLREQQANGLRAALRERDCPHWHGAYEAADNGLIGGCVDGGHCTCGASEALSGVGPADETTTKPAPTAVRFTFDAGRMEPILEWTRMPSGAYVVLAGTADNFDSLWFDCDGHHPKSELIFAQLIPQPTAKATEAMMARARSAQKAGGSSDAG